MQRLLGGRAAVTAPAALVEEPPVKDNVASSVTSSMAGSITGGMNLADESCRQRLLASGPVGAWRTVPGSHQALYDESIRFDADGTGSMQTGGSPSGATTRPFLWRCAGYGVVECQPIYQEPEVSTTGAPEERDWFRIAFVIEPQATDAGNFWVLRETNSGGFWDLMTPLVPDN
jgi:hypothetical protein